LTFKLTSLLLQRNTALKNLIWMVVTIHQSRNPLHHHRSRWVRDIRLLKGRVFRWYLLFRVGVDQRMSVYVPLVHHLALTLNRPILTLLD